MTNKDITIQFSISSKEKIVLVASPDGLYFTVVSNNIPAIEGFGSSLPEAVWNFCSHILPLEPTYQNSGDELDQLL